MKNSLFTIAATTALVASSANAALENILTKNLYNQIFPSALPIYKYENMISTAKKYPSFANTGNSDVDKREVAAFLGQIALESGYLQYVEEIAKSDYCQASQEYPCAAGKQYYGMYDVVTTYVGNSLLKINCC